jgi:oxygen-dependent protoporphyrinogen oxidase
MCTIKVDRCHEHEYSEQNNHVVNHALQALNAEHKGEVSSMLVTEARDRVGGNITTVSNDAEGLLWEEGPNSFQPSDAILKAAVDANIVDELVLGDPKAPRFVYWEGRLRPTPSGPDVLTFDLMSIFGKIRAGLGAIGIKSPMPEYEETVEQFVRRNLGDEVFYRLIEPFCSGVYAGDPTKLSMKAAFGKVYDLESKGGSIIGGVIKLLQDRKNNPPPERDSRLPPKPAGQTVGSFRRGLQTLPKAIAEKLSSSIRTSWNLTSITKDKESGIFELSYETPEGNKVIKTRTVALTVPSYVAAELFQQEIPEASEALNSFDYPPVAAVTLTYPESAILSDRLDDSGSLPGFGQLHPRTQGITTLGTIYSSSLFPGRVKDGEVLLLSYFGGALNRKVKDMSDDEIIAQVDKDLRKMLIKTDAPSPKKVAVRVWPRAIPQFNLGHLDMVEKAETGLRNNGWDNLFLGGNYVSGVALGKCVEYGYEFANKIASSVSKVTQ